MRACSVLLLALITTIAISAPAYAGNPFSVSGILKTALFNVTGHDIIIPGDKLQFTDYVLPDTGYVYGLIVRESDRMLMAGTAYLSNGKTFEVTDPLQQYVLEAEPGNYTLYAVSYDEEGRKLASDKIAVQIIPTENMYDLRPVDLIVKPVSPENLAVLMLAIGLGLACILALHYGLHRLV